MKRILVFAFLFSAAFVSAASADDTANRCRLAKEPGSCRGFFPRYFHNPATGQCERFIYGGCQGNANNFQTLEECQAACPSNPASAATCACAAPKKVGPCRAAIVRYFWNTSTGTCDRFSWGGCQANGNNFATRAACRRKCAPAVATPVTETRAPQ
jgi:hypothetical protein